MLLYYQDRKWLNQVISFLYGRWDSQTYRHNRSEGKQRRWWSVVYKRIEEIWSGVGSYILKMMMRWCHKYFLSDGEDDEMCAIYMMILDDIYCSIYRRHNRQQQIWNFTGLFVLVCVWSWLRFASFFCLLYIHTQKNLDLVCGTTAFGSSRLEDRKRINRLIRLSLNGCNQVRISISLYHPYPLIRTVYHINRLFIRIMNLYPLNRQERRIIRINREEAIGYRLL
jgi:hypothetical protein